jgi:carbon-monoxide dehydrogenase large subunit
VLAGLGRLVLLGYGLLQDALDALGRGCGLSERDAAVERLAVTRDQFAAKPEAADAIVDKGRRIAGAVLEAAALGDGIPNDLRGPLMGISDETMSIPSYAYTCAVCELEVDPETGLVEVVRYASIDDCGRAVNPMLIHGQSHGGIAQGIGQALWEACVYDPRSGQLMSGSFLDYAMPRADLLPAFDTEISEVPSTTNPLGMRGGSEGGITPGLAAVANAIVDALAEFGVEHIELPATPERVWNAIREARGQRASDPKF